MATKTVISTIRHAKTDFNTEKRYAGSIDVSINETGIRDSMEVSATLSRFDFDIIVSSNLKRSIETAQILLNNSVPIIQSKLCAERNFGVFEGRTWQEVQDEYPQVLWIKVGDDTHSVNPQGSESFEQVWERARKFRNFLFREYNGHNILVVSHGVFLQMFHGLLRGLNCIESLAVYPSNLELTTFNFKGKQFVDERIYKVNSMENEAF